MDGAPPLVAGRVILATGGLSVPTTGSDGAGLQWLAAMGHRIHPTYPALTPLTGDSPAHHSLAGISLVTRITARGGGPPRWTEGGFLFTHRGWSGPAVLDISHLAVRSRLSGGAHQPLLVRWTGAGTEEWEARLQPGSGQVASPIRQAMPERLATLLLSEAGIAPATQLSQLRREDRRRLVTALAEYPLPWSGDEGYRKAEVTGGGLALDEVHSHSLESRRHTGLHVCGEALDAFGPIGGHNFLWAWATGRQAGAAAAAQSIA
jgi:predicted Rossmann fold flavoprotein